MDPTLKEMAEIEAQMEPVIRQVGQELARSMAEEIDAAIMEEQILGLR